MSTREAFGPNLRRTRLHRRVSLEMIAHQTKVGIELWEAMERNDFTSWPSGLYARAYVREYAELIGADPDGTVNEFCRWFSQGDRRAEPLVRGQAEIVGHQLAWHDDLVPLQGDRRESAETWPDRLERVRKRHVRLIAAVLDGSFVLLVSAMEAALLSLSMWVTFGVTTALYHGVSLALMGCTPAVWAIDTYAAAHPDRRRPGELFALRRLRSGRRDDASPRRGAVSD